MGCKPSSARVGWQPPVVRAACTAQVVGRAALIAQGHGRQYGDFRAAEPQHPATVPPGSHLGPFSGQALALLWELWERRSLATAEGEAALRRATSDEVGEALPAALVPLMQTSADRDTALRRLRLLRDRDRLLPPSRTAGILHGCDPLKEAAESIAGARQMAYYLSLQHGVNMR